MVDLEQSHQNSRGFLRSGGSVGQRGRHGQDQEHAPQNALEPKRGCEKLVRCEGNAFLCPISDPPLQVTNFSWVKWKLPLWLGATKLPHANQPGDIHLASAFLHKNRDELAQNQYILFLN